MKIVAPIILITAAVIFLSNTTSNMEKQNSKTQIARVWRGWTSKENGKALEKILREVAIPGIEKNKPNGLKGIQLLTFEHSDEIAFTTIMYFESLQAVKEFAGEDYTKAHIDPAVAPLLNRYDKVVEHHMIKESRTWE